MNKVLSVLLMLAVLLGLAGCAGEAVTGSDAPQAQEDGVSSDQILSAVSTTPPPSGDGASSDAAPSAVSTSPTPSVASTQTANRTEIPFKSWTKETLSEQYWNLNDGVFACKIDEERFGDMPGVQLFRSRAELDAFMTDYQMPTEYAVSYSDQYFAKNDLILLKGGGAQGGIEWYADALTVADDVLYLSVVRRESGDGITAIQYHIYPIEIHQKLPAVHTIRCTVTDQTERDGTYTTQGQETTEYAVS